MRLRLGEQPCAAAEPGIARRPGRQPGARLRAGYFGDSVQVHGTARAFGNGLSAILARPTPDRACPAWSLNCRDGEMETTRTMQQTNAIWIKDPLAILADGAERGIVVQNGRIVELVPTGGEPATPAAAFEAG